MNIITDQPTDQQTDMRDQRRVTLPISEIYQELNNLYYTLNLTFIFCFRCFLLYVRMSVLTDRKVSLSLMFTLSLARFLGPSFSLSRSLFLSLAFSLLPSFSLRPPLPHPSLTKIRPWLNLLGHQGEAGKWVGAPGWRRGNYKRQIIPGLQKNGRRIGGGRQGGSGRGLRGRKG